jgi:hypothetical protein
MKNLKLLALLSLSIFSIVISSCSAIAGIFKAGMGFGIFIVVVIVVIVVVLIMRASNKTN